MKPSVGRIVHYNKENQKLAAIIVRVLHDDHVNLQVFNAGTAGTFFVTECKYTNGGAEGCWEWPARVSETE